MCTQRSPDNINVEIGIVVYTLSRDRYSCVHKDNINVEIGIVVYKRSPDNINVEIGIVVYTKVTR